MSKEAYGTAKAKSNPEKNLQSQTGREFLNTLQKAGSDLMRSAGSVLDTFTGKKVLEKIVEYVQESDEVNTAMATRIYDLLDRQTRLTARLSRVEGWLAAGLVVNGVSIIGFILYLLLRRP